MEWLSKEDWIKNHPNNRERMKIIAETLQHQIEPFCNEVIVAGSIRREKPIVNDIDLVAYLPYGNRSEFLDKLNKIGLKVVSFGDALKEEDIMNVEFTIPLYVANNTTGKEQKGQIFCTFDVRWLGGLLLHRTGSMDFNVYMSWMAKQRGMKLSMYGLFDREINEWLAGQEEQIFMKLHLLNVYPKNRNLGWLKKMGWWKSEHNYRDLKEMGIIPVKQDSLNL